MHRGQMARIGKILPPKWSAIQLNWWVTLILPQHSTGNGQYCVNGQTGHQVEWRGWDRKALRVHVSVGPESQVPSHAHSGLKMPGWAWLRTGEA